MKTKFLLMSIVGSVVLLGSGVCHAEKWDKNGYTDSTIEAGYYDVDSIKVNGRLVSWTEKYVLTKDGAAYVNSELEKHEACKKSIEKNGKATQYQLDYQVERRKFRGVAKRYYNSANKLICTNKETGTAFKTDWDTILRGSPIQQAQYDLVTKYKVKF